MALNLSFGGGDSNEYASAASQAAGKGGGINIIASFLDAMGIGTQVIKGSKKEQKSAEKASGMSEPLQITDSNPIQGLPILSAIESTFGIPPLIAPIRSADQNNKIKSIDPDIGFK